MPKARVVEISVLSANDKRKDKKRKMKIKEDDAEKNLELDEHITL